MSNVIDVVVPTVGESVSEGAIGRWFVKDGDYVAKDEPLFELDSDKASMEVPANESGRVQIIASEGDTVAVGSTVAKIDTQAAPSEKKKVESPKKAPATNGSAKATESKAKKSENTTSQKQASASGSSDDSKLVNFTPSQRKAIRHGTLKPESAKPKLGESSEDSGVRREPMSALRRTIASRLIHSQQSTATLTTFNEVDMSTLLNLRSSVKDEFQKKFEVKLGFMSFFSAAIAYGMKEFPIVNAHIDNKDIVYPDSINLGIAVSSEKGLVVPVLRDVESLSYAKIESGIADLADRARSGKLSIAEMQGGSFTLTNGGVFGSLLSTPILNPPQSGILGMHKTEHRPIAIEENGKFKVEVRPMMYLALSYDHRLIDGKTSVSFLVKVKEYLESVTKDQVFASSLS